MTSTPTIDVNNPPANQRGTCPRCEQERLWVGTNSAFNALSRRDNKTLICSPCGQDQAIRDWLARDPAAASGNWLDSYGKGDPR